MREGVDIYTPHRALLNTIVADGRSRVESFVDVALFQQSALIGRVSPDAGIAVGLQLDPDRNLIRLRRI
jgi:hypothetical protein